MVLTNPSPLCDLTNRSVSLRAAFGREFMLGDYKAAERTLEVVETTISKSLWSLDKRFLLAQYKSGFFENKKLLGELHCQSRNDYINILSLLFSLRVEATIDAPSYWHLIDNKIAEIDKNYDSTAAYFRSLLNFPCPFQQNHASFILFKDEGASMVDRFNGIGRFLRSYIAAGNDTGELNEFAPRIAKLAQVTSDPTLLTVSRLLSQKIQGISEPSEYGDFLNGLDCYTAGDYASAVAAFSAFLPKYPTWFAVYYLLAKCCVHTNQAPSIAADSSSVASKILWRMTDLFSGKGDPDEHLISLLKIATDLGENNLGFGLSNFVFKLIGGWHSGANDIEVQLSSKFPDPWTESVGENSEYRLASLAERFPESNTIQFLQAKVRKCLVSTGGGSRLVQPDSNSIKQLKSVLVIRRSKVLLILKMSTDILARIIRTILDLLSNALIHCFTPIFPT